MKQYGFVSALAWSFIVLSLAWWEQAFAGTRGGAYLPGRDWRGGEDFPRSGVALAIALSFLVRLGRSKRSPARAGRVPTGAGLARGAKIFLVLNSRLRVFLSFLVRACNRSLVLSSRLLVFLLFLVRLGRSKRSPARAGARTYRGGIGAGVRRFSSFWVRACNRSLVLSLAWREQAFAGTRGARTYRGGIGGGAKIFLVLS
ncbi:hypothetical protein TRSA_19790 [Treponema saccharophilum]|nr:hypothetical protein TRSA_19790 [Treponema saccharophilum]